MTPINLCDSCADSDCRDCTGWPCGCVHYCTGCGESRARDCRCDDLHNERRGK